MLLSGRKTLAIPVAIGIAAASTAAAVAAGFAGDTLQMVRSDGGRARLLFLPGGKVVFEGIMTKNVMSGRGTYTETGTSLCYDTSFPGEECWKLARPLALGQPVSAVNDDGKVKATFTLRAGSDAPIPIPDGSRNVKSPRHD